MNVIRYLCNTSIPTWLKYYTIKKVPVIWKFFWLGRTIFSFWHAHSFIMSKGFACVCPSSIKKRLQNLSLQNSQLILHHIIRTKVAKPSNSLLMYKLHYSVDVKCVCAGYLISYKSVSYGKTSKCSQAREFNSRLFHTHPISDLYSQICSRLLQLRWIKSECKCGWHFSAACLGPQCTTHTHTKVICYEVVPINVFSRSRTAIRTLIQSL